MTILRPRLHFENHYTTIPNAWARDSRLTMRARGLLLQLLSHAPGWRVSVESLVRDNPEGHHAVRTALLELEEYGYLVREQQVNAEGRFTSVDYTLTDPSITVVGKSDSGGSDVGGSATKKEHLLEDHLPEPNEEPLAHAASGESPRQDKQQTIEELFNQWWTEYPRKVGRRAARKAYEKVLLEEAAGWDLDYPARKFRLAAAAYAADPNREAAFTAHPTTWLNQGRWDDGPLAPRKPGSNPADRMAGYDALRIDEEPTR